MGQDQTKSDHAGGRRFWKYTYKPIRNKIRGRGKQ